MKFSMTISLGNAAMLTSEDLADRLKVVAMRLETQDYVRQVKDEGSMDPFVRGVSDLNGNMVGRFTLQLEVSDIE
jgi:hypothetical protein